MRDDEIMTDMNKPQSNNPRARLQALRAIPERDRTEAEWDELNELEIMLASENRQPAPGQQQPMQQPRGGGGGGGGGGGAGNQGSGGKPQGAPHGQSERKFHKRPRRRKTP
jgi:hypothetical protein